MTLCSSFKELIELSAPELTSELMTAYEPHLPNLIQCDDVPGGTKANIIPNQATLTVRVRSDSRKQQVLDAIRRIPEAECAAGSEQPPAIETFSDFPVTANDDDVTSAALSYLTGSWLPAGRISYFAEANPATSASSS